MWPSSPSFCFIHRMIQTRTIIRSAVQRNQNKTKWCWNWIGPPVSTISRKHDTLETNPDLKHGMAALRKLRSFAQCTVSLKIEHKIKLKHKFATDLLYFPNYQQLCRTESWRTTIYGKVTSSSTTLRTVLRCVHKISKSDFEMSPSIGPPTRMQQFGSHTERIFIKFDMSIFENLSRNFKMH